jgi:ABC-type Fe3+-hydroxamate transport system substrate-binding protein
MGRTKGSGNRPKSSDVISGVGEIRKDDNQSDISTENEAEGAGNDAIALESGNVTNIVSEVTEIVTFVVDKEKEGAENWNQLKERIDFIAEQHHKKKQVVKLFVTCDNAPTFYNGMFGGAEIIKDVANKIRWSSGEESEI